jgi:hypothetical protein
MEVGSNGGDTITRRRKDMQSRTSTVTGSPTEESSGAELVEGMKPTAPKMTPSLFPRFMHILRSQMKFNEVGTHEKSLGERTVEEERARRRKKPNVCCVLTEPGTVFRALYQLI